MADCDITRTAEDSPDTFATRQDILTTSTIVVYMEVSCTHIGGEIQGHRADRAAAVLTIQHPIEVGDRHLVVPETGGQPQGWIRQICLAIT